VGAVSPECSLGLFDENFNYVKGYTEITDCGFTGLDIWDHLIVTCDKRSLYFLDKDLNLIDKIYDIGIDLHGLKCVYNRIFVVSTGESRIKVFDTSTMKIIQEYQHKDYFDSDSSHINDIDIYGDMMSVCVHNKDNEGYVYGLNLVDDITYPGKVINILGNKFIFARNLFQPHNFKFMEDGYLVNNSKANEIDYVKMPIELSWEKKGLLAYTRGLEVVDNIIYIGASKRKGEDVDNFKAIYILNKFDGKLISVKIIRQEDKNSEIYAIRFLD